MSLDPTFVSQILIYLTGYGALFLTVLWIAAVAWTWQDINSRTKDRNLRLLSLLVSIFLLLPGVLIYLLFRPRKTLDEAYQYSLEEEALLQTVDDYATCPGCKRHIQENWKICPDCQTQLRVACKNCGKLLQLEWTVCPFCATEQATITTPSTATIQSFLPHVEDE